MKIQNPGATTTQPTEKQQTQTIVAQIIDNKDNNETPIVDSTNAHNQRMFILNQLKNNGPINTLQFRAMGVASPAPRILELRRKGFKIDMVRIVATDGAGVEHHNIALYALISSVDAEVVK